MPDTANGSQWLSDRRYATDVPSILPIDDQEIDRLDLQQYLLRFALKGNYLALIEEPTRILDVRCGAERWVVEMAHEFAQAEVVGLDLQPPQASESFVSSSERELMFKERKIASHAINFSTFLENDRTARRKVHLCVMDTP
jgi:tRNA G46 methylase TrmB